jgi:hypothetical protein
MGGLCALRALGGSREANVPTEPSPARQDARVPRANGDEGRPEGAEAPARQGATPADGLGSARGAARVRGAAACGAASVPSGVRPTLPTWGACGEPCVRAALAADARTPGGGLRRGSPARWQRREEPRAATTPGGLPAAARSRGAGGNSPLLHRPPGGADEPLRPTGRCGGWGAGPNRAAPSVITRKKEWKTVYL